MVTWAAIRIETKLQVLARTFDANPFQCWKKLESYSVEDLKAFVNYVAVELAEFEPEKASPEEYATYLSKTQLTKLGTPAFWAIVDNTIREYAKVMAVDPQNAELNYSLDIEDSSNDANSNLVKFAIRCVSMRSKRFPLIFS